MKDVHGSIDPKELVCFEQVTKDYAVGTTPAVSRLSFAMHESEIIALLGPSGSGKTTTLRLLAGFEKPDDGRILLGGHVVSGDGLWVTPENRHIGMVFQDYALFPHMTLAENVVFGLKTASRRERAARAEMMLSVVGMRGMEKRYPHELSGGQQQRVAIARALAPNPIVLLMDEPFSNLDTDMRAEMREEVVKILRSSGTSAIVVTHDQEEAFVLADRVGVINEGRLEQLSRPEELYRRPRTRFVARFVGQADFIPGEVRQGIRTEVGCFRKSSELPEGTKVEMMVRPDEVDLNPAEDGEALITQRRFRGVENLYRLTLRSGTLLHSSQPSTRTFETGSRVKLDIKVANVVVFPIE